jgi:small GTP-binding protein
MSRQLTHTTSLPASTSTTTPISPTPSPLEAKLVLLGSQGVGKTSLISRLLSPQGPLPENPPSTIGASFITHRIHDPDTSTTVRLQIWDTAGQERFRSISRLYYRGAHVGLLCYDITDAASWDDMQDWLRELRENCPPENEEDGGLIIHVVGTKSDIVALDPSKREVLFERTIAYMAEQLAGATTPPMTLKDGRHAQPPYSLSASTYATPSHTNPPSKRSSGFWGTEFSPAWSAAHEVSSADGEGIEEVFRVIARKLVERRHRREAADLARLTQHQRSGTGRSDHSDDFFGYSQGQSAGSFRLGPADKKRSWLGLSGVGLGIGVGSGEEGGSGFGGRSDEDNDVENDRRRGRCC